MKFVWEKGNQVTVESDQGVQYKRNVTDVKWFHPLVEYVTPNKEHEKLKAEYLDPGEQIDIDPLSLNVVSDESKEIQLTCPKRVSELPKIFYPRDQCVFHPHFFKFNLMNILLPTQIIEL